ncbi:MAG: Glucosyl-transferase [Microgenomates group bacterium Gr01-1014_16]|nr:MAG: Glucosyl-transferase [Microgenomates group bacterium Gr01-1014_16]
MKKNLKLSVVLATFNEEENLGQCLESVQDIIDEIVVVDGESTDKTVEIAKKFGARIISTTNKPNFHINKNMAIDAATGDWILQLDADEVVSPELSSEIKKEINSKKYNGYWMNRKNWFLNRFLTKGGQYPDPTLRLYRKGKGRLPANDVHEQAEVESEVGHLKNDLLHYRDTSFEKYMEGFNRYTTFVSLQLADRKININLSNALLYLFLKPPLTFLKIYFRHRGYVDGMPGFIFALFSGLIHAVAYIKYWQHTKYSA